MKISEKQAIKMAYCTIFSDETEEKCRNIVRNIMECWKNEGYIKGYHKKYIDRDTEESKGKIK